MVREDVENLSELSEDVKYVKRELERQNKLTFLAKKFLAEKNLDDLEEYKEKEVAKVLTDLGANTVDVEDNKGVAAMKKKKFKIPDTMLTKFLNLNTTLLLATIGVFGLCKIILSIIVMKRIDIAFEYNSSRTAYTIYNIVMGFLLILVCFILLESVVRYRLKILKFGSLIFIFFLFINCLPIAKTNVLYFKNDLVVKHYLWSGIEYDEDMGIISSIQQKLKCCGVFNWTDWRFNTELNDDVNVPAQNLVMHPTCCQIAKVHRVACTLQQEFYKMPCNDPVKEFMKTILLFLIPFYIILQLLFLLCMLSAFALSYHYQQIAKKLNLTI